MGAAISGYSSLHFDFSSSFWRHLRTRKTDSKEQRLHKTLSRNGLTVPCKVSFVDIPVTVERAASGRPAIMGIESWPILLPMHLVEALVAGGQLPNLLGDRVQRLNYWDRMLRDFPSLNIDPEMCAPLAFYGDEATVFGSSCMCMHWAPSLHPKKSNSMQSRFLLCVVPSEKYWVESWFALLRFAICFLTRSSLGLRA